jgi:hypothetical protein
MLHHYCNAIAYIHNTALINKPYLEYLNKNYRIKYFNYFGFISRKIYTFANSKLEGEIL